MIQKLSLAFFIIALLASCAMPGTGPAAAGSGNVQFSIGRAARAAVIPPSEDVDAVVVTIEDSGGNIIHDMQRVALYDMGGGFRSCQDSRALVYPHPV